jgi:hypothetical protein
MVAGQVFWKANAVSLVEIHGWRGWMGWVERNEGVETGGT